MRQRINNVTADAAVEQKTVNGTLQQCQRQENVNNKNKRNKNVITDAKLAAAENPPSSCAYDSHYVRTQLFVYPALPAWEMALCWAITLGTVCYAWAAVWQASAKWEFRMGHPASVVELPLVGRRFKDQSNWEWFRWSPFAVQYLPALLLHSAAFNLLPMVFPRHQLVWTSLYALLSMALSAWVFGTRLLLCSLAQGLLIFGCTLFARRSVVVWLSAVPLLYVVMNRTDWVGDDPFLVLLFVSYTLLSYISFCLDLTRQQQQNQSPNTCWWQLLSRMLLYAFYQPYLFSLIVLYTDFERQLAERNAKSRHWCALLWKAGRVAFWWALCELSLHFLYFGAITTDPVFMDRLPKDQFASLGMAMGSFFHLKYVVIFGLPAVFAQLDGMEPPDGPICISRVSLYSKIWRGFDRGLYAFFKTYIFIPICRPTFSLCRKLFGICVSFTFVLLWHGFYHHNLVWIGLNIAELTIEFGAKAFYSVPSIQKTRERILSDRNFRRLLGWLQVLPFAFGLYSNFYFLGGSAVGWLFVRRIFLEETITLRWPAFLLICCGYFYMQMAMEVDRLWPTGIATNNKGRMATKIIETIEEEERKCPIRLWNGDGGKEGRNQELLEKQQKRKKG